MKRTFGSIFTLSLALMLVFSLSAFAQQSAYESHHPNPDPPEGATDQPSQPAGMGGMMQGMMPGMMGGPGQGQGMMGGGMMGMMPGMMQGMMPPMMGGPGQGQGTMGQGMMGMCPMCGKMMSGMMGGGMMGMMPGMMGMMHGQGMGPGGMHAGQPLPMRLLKQADALKLSDEQKAQLREIATALRKQTIEQRAARELAQVDLDNLLADPKSELGAIEEALKAIARTDVASRLNRIKADREAKGILTPDQLEKWQALQKAKPAMGMGHMGKKKPQKDGKGKPQPKVEKQTL